MYVIGYSPAVAGGEVAEGLLMAVSHIRVTFSGKLSSGLDIWSTGFSTIPKVGITNAEAEQMSLAGLTHFSSQYFTPLAGATPTSCTFTACDVAAYNALGQNIAQGHSELATPLAGTVTSQAMPPECSVVASLRTPTAGPRGRGRMYLPPLAGNNLTVDGQLITGSRDSIALRVKNLLQTWNDDPLTMSAAVASSVGGFVTAINRIQVGLVVDAQRRRRNSIPEVYKTEPVTP